MSAPSSQRFFTFRLTNTFPTLCTTKICCIQQRFQGYCTSICSAGSFLMTMKQRTEPWYQWFVSWPQPPENSNTQYKTQDGWPAGACRTLHPHEWKWYHCVAKEEMEAAIMADVVQCRGCIDMSQQNVDWNVVLIVMLRMFYTAPCSPSWFLAYVV